MTSAATGVSWDALEAAVGLESVAQIKGPSIGVVSERIDQILGKLDLYDLEDEIPRDSIPPIRQGIAIERLHGGLFAASASVYRKRL